MRSASWRPVRRDLEHRHAAALKLLQAGVVIDPPTSSSGTRRCRSRRPRPGDGAARHVQGLGSTPRPGADSRGPRCWLAPSVTGRHRYSSANGRLAGDRHVEIVDRRNGRPATTFECRAHVRAVDYACRPYCRYNRGAISRSSRQRSSTTSRYVNGRSRGNPRIACGWGRGMSGGSLNRRGSIGTVWDRSEGRCTH
jgi:hypothetical protein